MLKAGVGRQRISPPKGVELTGWGYYLNRTWETVHDDLNATSLILDSDACTLAIVSLDLMVIGESFTADVRKRVEAVTGIPAGNVLVCCTHTHNAPSSHGLEGVGEVDPLYEAWAAEQAATSAILAWSSREDATIATGSSDVSGVTFNRTRENGPVDSTLTVMRVDRSDGSPLAAVVSFQGHPTVSTVLRPGAVSRDLPGRVCDAVEQELSGCRAIYLQGACGDVNFLREYSAPEREHEPAISVAQAAIRALREAKQQDSPQLAAQSQRAKLPTRRWTREEIVQDRAEAERRLGERDISGWRESIGRAMTNRPDDMVARHGGDEWKAVEAMCRFNMTWTDRMLEDLDDRPECLETEVQSIRIGDLGIVSNSSEFFTTLALDVRHRSPFPNTMLVCYANGRIGYVPDAHDVERKTYAAWQSPKYCNQFPFTDQSGPALCDAMVDALNQVGG